VTDGAGGAHGPPGVTRTGGVLSRYRTSLWLFAITVALALLAYAIYPETAPVVPSDAVKGVAVVATFSASALNVNQVPDPRIDGFTLQIVVHASDAPTTSPAGHTGYVSVQLPGTAWGSRRRCPPPAVVCRHDGAGLKDAAYWLASRWVQDPTQLPSYRWENTVTFSVPGVGSNVSDNDEYISVLTPPISFQFSPDPSFADASFQPVPTLFAVRVPSNAYTWTTGADPVYLDGFDRWSSTSSGSIQDTVSPVLVSGTDLGVLDRNGNLQFIAGIVVGVAGGTLVGSLQEWMSSRRRPQEP